LALIDELRRVVPFDAYAWLLTDPETEVGSAPLADVPCLPELPRLIRLKYLTEINRWTALEDPVASLSLATEGDLGRSVVWRELLSRYSVNDVASLVFRDRFGCWGFLDLWLSGSRDRFTEADLGYLKAVIPVMTSAQRNAHAQEFFSHGRALERTGPIVLVLSPELEVKAQTPETQRYLRMLLPPDGGGPPIPAAAYNVAAQLIASEAGVDNHLPMARVHLADGTWLTLRAARIESQGSMERDVAVTIESTTPTERLDLFSRVFALTSRESDLLRLLATGADTRTVAQRMFVSEHTVQDHLKSVFAKTQTRSRRSLLAAATGE
jgi:DNA-binding CsgD family transcriptional regulator